MSENNRRKMSFDEIEAAEELSKKSEKKKFNIFGNLSRDGAGVSKEEIPIADEPTLKNFFKLIKRKISQLLSVNIIMILGNFPIFFFFLGMSGYLSIQTTSPSYLVFGPLYGASLINNSPATATLMSIFSRQSPVTIQTTADYIILGIACLIILTFGLVRVDVTYIVRNIFRGEPVFLIHDFFYAIKRNLKQALAFGVLDVLITVMIFYDIIFFNLNYNANFMISTMFFMSLCLALLYFFMRHYIYIMLVTFDLSLFKLFKNALLFTILGIKRNIMLLLGTAMIAAVEYFLFYLYFPLAVILPFVIIPSMLVLMGIYAAYPKIKEIMIDPYYEKAEE